MPTKSSKKTATKKPSEKCAHDTAQILRAARLTGNLYQANHLVASLVNTLNQILDDPKDEPRLDPSGLRADVLELDLQLDTLQSVIRYTRTKLTNLLKKIPKDG